MAVYVDDMHTTDMGRFGRMKMCHMLATSDDELHAMAEAIGVARKHWQAPPHDSHYDIAMSKRALAVQLGALECTMREAVFMLRVKRKTGVMGSLEDARAFFAERAVEVSRRRYEVTQLDLFGSTGVA